MRYCCRAAFSVDGPRRKTSARLGEAVALRAGTENEDERESENEDERDWEAEAHGDWRSGDASGVEVEAQLAVPVVVVATGEEVEAECSPSCCRP
jgi:hypothetical protein